jgi:hypothetical protein
MQFPIVQNGPDRGGVVIPMPIDMAVTMAVRTEVKKPIRMIFSLAG